MATNRWRKRKFRDYLVSCSVTPVPICLGLITILVWAYMNINDESHEIHRSPSPATLATLPSSAIHIHPSDVGKLPALGWSSWNAFFCDIDSTKIMTAANQLVSLGLKEAGYEYINIDDCWSIKSGRDKITRKMIPDPSRFPDGIAGLANQIHALGLKIGLYSSAGTKTCKGYPASLGYEDLDASTFAEWDIDYFKYDGCHVPKKWKDKYEFCVPDSSHGHIFPNGTCDITKKTAPDDYDWSTSKTARRYNIMGDALRAQNRTILYSLCNGGKANVVSWGNATGHSWRMSGDITPYWWRVAQILNENSFLLNSVDFWAHNDADMLEVGNGNLTMAETRSHFAFWAAMKSPLIIGTALDKLPLEHVGILANKYLLAFNQDEVYGKPAIPYKWGVNPDWTFNETYPAEYWSGMSSHGVFLLMLNSLEYNSTRQAKWAEVPELDESSAYQVTDIWAGENLGCLDGGISRMLESHDTAAFLVGKKCSAKR